MSRNVLKEVYDDWNSEYGNVWIIDSEDADGDECGFHFESAWATENEARKEQTNLQKKHSNTYYQITHHFVGKSNE